MKVITTEEIETKIETKIKVEIKIEVQAEIITIITEIDQEVTEHQEEILTHTIIIITTTITIIQREFKLQQIPTEILKIIMSIKLVFTLKIYHLNWIMKTSNQSFKNSMQQMQTLLAIQEMEEAGVMDLLNSIIQKKEMKL